MPGPEESLNLCDGQQSKFSFQTNPAPALAKPRILFLVCKAGGGHQAAARALSAAIEQRFPNQYQTITLAAEEMVGPIGRCFGEFFSGAYNHALRSGQYWLEPLIFMSLTCLRKWLTPLGIHHYERALLSYRPDIIVSLIHGSHDALHSVFDRNGYIPNLTVVTDMVSIRKDWVHLMSDQIIVSTPEARTAVLARGILAERIQLIGHPIHPQFNESKSQKSKLFKRRYHLKPNLLTVMMLMGGTGGKNILHFSKQIVISHLPIQIIACCGQNPALIRKIKNLNKKSRHPIRIFGYTKKIPELMASADLIITKPGPGTIMEALASDLPIVVDDSNYTMWQERGNVEYVLKYNLGEVISHRNQLLPLLTRILAEPTILTEHKAAIKKLKQPRSSQIIAELIDHRLSKSRH